MENKDISMSDGESTFRQLHTITPLSKYLAMALFVILPFVGGWIGYQYAPETVPTTFEKAIEEETSKAVGEVANEDLATPYERLTLPDMTMNDPFIIVSPPVGTEGKRYLKMVSRQAVTPDDIVVEELGGYIYQNRGYDFSTDLAPYTDTDVYFLNPDPHDNRLSDGYDKSTQFVYHYSAENLALNKLLKITDLGIHENHISYIRKVKNTFAAPDTDYLSLIEQPCLRCDAGSVAVWYFTYNKKTGAVSKPIRIEDYAQFQWTGEKTFQYKEWPKEGHPEYRYRTDDRSNPEVACGLGGCPESNIDWSSIPVITGSL